MGFHEPPLSADDTTPTSTINMVEINEDGDGEPPLSAWRRAAGCLTLVLAAVFTLIAALLILLPPDETPQPAPAVTSTSETVVMEVTLTLPTDPPPTVPPDTPPDLLPTLSSDAINQILSQPLVVFEAGGATIRTERNPYDPFTLIPDRPRNEVIEYVVEDGDTIFGIAERFGLSPETIAWSNDRSIIGSLRPGRPINVPPVNGVYHQVIGSSTIAEIAASYGISDPNVITDSEYNNLFGTPPDTVLPSGTWIMIPGGVAEQIAWTPRVEREGSNANTTGGDFVSFAPGEPGSCGRVQNVSGTSWARPIASYQWTRGFTSWHTGVDLSASPGTPIFAANGGVVIFSGWNSFGYGDTIVLSHGPFSTVYGHLSSRNVGCGQVVAAGQQIGGVGSTGNSSGPHLHFEIRYLDQPTDPTTIMGF